MKSFLVLACLLLSMPSFAETITDCDSLGFSHPTPLAKWKMKNGVELFICELNDTNEISKTEFKGWANVYKVENGKLVPYLTDVNSEMPSGFQDFTIKKVDSSKILISRNLSHKDKEATGDMDFVATTATIDCSKKTCVMEKEKCMRPSKEDIDKKAIKTVQDVLKGKVQADDVDYESVMHNLMRSALAGDKQAQKIVLKTDPTKLHVDGAVAEEFFDGKDLLERLIKIKCF